MFQIHKFGRGSIAGRYRCASISLLGLAIGMLVALPASAQNDFVINPAQPERSADHNGVDYVSGTLRVDKPLILAGDPQNPMNVVMHLTAPAYDADVATLSTDVKNTGYLSALGTIYSFRTPIGSAIFHPGASWLNNPSSPPAWSIGDGVFGMPRGIGWALYFNGKGDKFDSFASTSGILNLVTFASGETWSYYYTSGGLLKFIVSSRGYGLQFSYNGTINKITFYNKAYVYCDESALTDCTAVIGLPTTVTMTTDTNGTTVAPPGVAGFRYKKVFGGTSVYSDIESISTVGVANSTVSYTYVHTPTGDSQGEVDAVASVSDGQNTWTYSHPAPNGDQVGNPYLLTSTAITDPTSKWTQGEGYSFIGALQNFRDELGRFWFYGRDSANFKTTAVVQPEGNGIEYTYDGRGNVVTESTVPKFSSGLSSISRTASYPTDCTTSNFKYCNKPTWVRDAKNNQTDLTYSADNGLPLTITKPADTNGVRPQTRYTYVQRYAWVLNSSSGYVHASVPVWLLATESYCRSSTATGNPTAPCTAGNNDEVKTVYDYGPDSGPNNLFLRGMAVTAETSVNGALVMVTRRTCYGNDKNGRRIWTTKPRANLASCS